MQNVEPAHHDGQHCGYVVRTRRVRNRTAHGVCLLHSRAFIRKTTSDRVPRTVDCEL